MTEAVRSGTNDPFADLATADSLRDEINRLKSEIEQLTARVEQLDELAHQDSLIDMPNRRGFMRQLHALIGRVQRYGERGAVLYVDLDGLKLINDCFGHPAGDQALIRVANLLEDGVRQGDCVARLGGDEFGILLAHADEASAEDTAARLVDQIAGCDFAHDGKALPLSVAIGVAEIRPDDEPAEVMARADAAMYSKKVTG